MQKSKRPRESSSYLEDRVAALEELTNTLLKENILLRAEVATLRNERKKIKHRSDAGKRHIMPSDSSFLIKSKRDMPSALLPSNTLPSAPLPVLISSSLHGRLELESDSYILSQKRVLLRLWLPL